jgi:hypothetical protein
MASAIKRTIRLQPSQARVLSAFAKRRELTEYAMLKAFIDIGIAQALRGADDETTLPQLTVEVAGMSVRMAEMERVLDRALFTACAAYAYARHAALGTKKPDEVIAAEARAAFERQRSLALDALS